MRMFGGPVGAGWGVFLKLSPQGLRLLSYRGSAALPGCLVCEEPQHLAQRRAGLLGEGSDAFLTRWSALPAAVTGKCGLSE